MYSWNEFVLTNLKHNELTSKFGWITVISLKRDKWTKINGKWSPFTIAEYRCDFLIILQYSKTIYFLKVQGHRLVIFCLITRLKCVISFQTGFIAHSRSRGTPQWPESPHQAAALPLTQATHCCHSTRSPCQPSPEEETGCFHRGNLKLWSV